MAPQRGHKIELEIGFMSDDSTAAKQSDSSSPLGALNASAAGPEPEAQRRSEDGTGPRMLSSKSPRFNKSHDMLEKQILFVFGMGRSGTSAVTRVLSLCGVSLPDVLIGANKGNPKGHWEPLDALVMNEDFLFRHGATWFDPTLRLQGEFVFHDEEREAYIEQIHAFLKTCASGRLTVIKEPRITALSDFWFEASQRAGFATKIVIPVRRPDEVAASLAARDRTSLELSSVLWLKYNLLAERRSRTFSRVFVEYPNLLSDWRREIARISEALSIELTAPNEAEINAFLDRDLHHQKHSGTPTEVFGLPLLRQVYAAFSAAARGAPLDLQAMDEIFATYSKCERTFRISLDEFRSRFGPAASPGSSANPVSEHCKTRVPTGAGVGEIQRGGL
jgi:hypothetical protein